MWDQCITSANEICFMSPAPSRQRTRGMNRLGTQLSTDAISLTKHFEGWEAPDKAPDKAPGPLFNWQMELIGATGLKWAGALTFQRTEPSTDETPAPLSRSCKLGFGASTTYFLLNLTALLSRDKRRSQNQAGHSPARLVSFITISIYPISPSETAASEAIFLNKW